MILALDTTHEFGSLALVNGEEVLEEVLLHAPEGFGQILYERLGRLLDRHGRKVREMEAFAAASGPGSFTGVRIGLACVKGLAEAASKPAVGISNLQALALYGAAPLRATLLDARRGEVYGAVYDARGQAVHAETVMRLPAWLATLPDGDLEFVCPDPTPFLSALAGTRFERCPVVTAPRALAGAIGRLAGRRLASGAPLDAALLDANYVRRSDAELLWKE